MTFLYRLFLAAGSLALLIALYFFGVGLADGSVSSFNIVLWLGILSTAGAILFAGHALRTNGHPKAAVALLAVLAVPGISYALLVILFVFSGARWN